MTEMKEKNDNNYIKMSRQKFMHTLCSQYTYTYTHSFSVYIVFFNIIKNRTQFSCMCAILALHHELQRIKYIPISALEFLSDSSNA